MGMFDDMKNKAADLAGQHSDKLDGAADQAVERAGDTVDERTGGKYAEHVDTGQARVNEEIDRRMGQ